MKITKELLENYRKMKREIPMLEEEIRNMREGDNGLNNSTVFDYRTGDKRPLSVIGFDWPLYEYRKNRLAKKKEKLAAVEMWIESIPDDQTRFVFRLYYIEGLTWKAIAGKMGFRATEDYLRIAIRDKYLRESRVF